MASPSVVPSTLTPRPPALFFGVPVDNVTMSETLGLIGSMVDRGRTQGVTHQVATVNVDFLVNSLSDLDLKSMLQGADLCIPDGMPLKWGAGPLGMRLKERVAGSDLLPLLVDASRSIGWHVHVFGSTAHVADSARLLLRDRYPGARFSIDPGPKLSDVHHVDDAVLESIAAVDADILCVALGNPKQERFIGAHRDRLRTPVMIGVGGSLDMLVGERRRAPVWVQRAGLEWVVRAAQEPRRLVRRYGHDIRVFVPAYGRQWSKKRRRQDGANARYDVASDAVVARLQHGGRFGGGDDWSSAAAAMMRGAALCVDAGSRRAIRDETAAELFGLVRLGRRSGAPVSWHHVHPDLRRCLGDLGLGSHLLHLGGDHDATDQ